MARLRLFANLREAAGTATADVPGDTVGSVLDEAQRRYGESFGAGLDAARVWLNGQPTDAGAPVSDEDEIAIIPPVSGGTVTSGVANDPMEMGLPVALLAAIFIGAWIPLEWYVVVAVGAALAWVWDLGEVCEGRGEPFNMYAALIGPAVVGGATYAWGFPGFAGAIAFSIIVAVTWPVFDAGVRDVRVTATTTTVAVTGGLAVGGLVLLRMMSTTAVIVFMAIAVGGLLLAAVAQAYGTQIQSVDPNVGALLGALGVGLLSGAISGEIDLAAALLGSVAVAAGLIGGRAFGSMLRSGEVAHTVHPPGVLTAVDGVLIAAPLFWLTLWVFG